ncbi:hypothetical protein C7H79_10805 [Nitrosomonas supralitoralis]|uniref:Uncharacterized protein n=1 Tax=Nitrosomonas supralitoralis TaxID=2116706 RepID=A0A2P7NU05_9PROT|nr:hypothetical protein C7H79_10805 [Nitrosomonas supralitoralis]
MQEYFIVLKYSILWCSIILWIGWRYHHQFDRLKLITNNSRLLILPQWHTPNAATRILSLCQRRLQTDWMRHFHHPLLLLETFVDPQHFHGTIYRAANWIIWGSTKGFRPRQRPRLPTQRLA